MTKKLQTALSLLDIAETNLRNAKILMLQALEINGGNKGNDTLISLNSGRISKDEEESKEVVEGYFDGEYMIGDNSQTYLVPQNYASKTQLVVGDRMKWILTPTREIFKLIQPVEREKVEGVFTIDEDSYLVIIDNIPSPVKILKASATFAMKTQGLKPGDIVSILIPKNTVPRWGAFLTVVKSNNIKPTINDVIDQNRFDDLEIFKSIKNTDVPDKATTPLTPLDNFDTDDYL
jgi:hypothetical protein